MFQSSPSPKAGRYVSLPSRGIPTGPFQSSPDRKAGHGLADGVPGQRRQVSILARHQGRALYRC